MRSKRRKWALNLIGIAAVLALGAVIWLPFQIPHSSQNNASVSQLPSATLEFDSEELVYTGSGMLDLMEGVRATDGDGTDLTGQVNAVITADGTLTRKTIRYSVYGQNGEVVTRQRSLLLQNYTGPTLEVTQPLQFDSEQLPRLIDYLQEGDLLRAMDGYGMEITGQVTCFRELQGSQEYSLTFRVINQFQDSVERTVSATITGDVSNPSIQLSTQEVQIPVGSSFEPLSYVLAADNGSGSANSGEIQIDSSVNTSQPGSYRVTYRLYNSDSTARTTQVLRVIVQ